MSEFSPPIQTTTLFHESRSICVVREDLLPGGTKQRAGKMFIDHLSKDGFRHFVYASPFCGFAQVALAYTCGRLGYDCTIFAEQDLSLNICGAKHPLSRLAEQYGAKVVTCSDLAAAETAAIELVASERTYYKIPLGFDSEIYRSFMCAEVEAQWHRLLEELPREPTTLWLPLGSGTLATIFSRIIGPKMRLNCVDVHILPEHDLRIARLRNRPNTKIFSARQKFPEPAQVLPDIPSNLFYDAKVWRFLLDYGQDGDIWWNVAR